VVKSKYHGRVEVYPNPAKLTHYSVDVTCSCEKQRKTHDLCWHAVAALNIFKKDPMRFVFVEDRPSTWKAQYEAGGEFEIRDPPSNHPMNTWTTLAKSSTNFQNCTRGVVVGVVVVGPPVK